MNIKADFKHVKGHQDDAKHYEELDLPAQLNTDVDFLASNYQTTKGMKCIKVLQLPINKAQLNMPDYMITSNYPKTLQDYATTKPLIDHLQEKHDWDSFTI
eukprot:8586281-Ditylum_brightwellii.AAC.1